MKRKLAIVLCVALLITSFGFMTAAADTTPNMALATSGTNFAQGDTVSVNVNLTGQTGNAAGIGGISGEIVYDPAVFSLTAATPDTGLKWLDASSFTAVSLTPNNGGDLDVSLYEAGHVSILFMNDYVESQITPGTYIPNPITTDSTLFTLKFVVLADAAVGSASIAWATGLNACDSDGNVIPVTSQDLSVNIDVPTTTTEATTTVAPDPLPPVVTPVVNEKTYLVAQTITFSENIGGTCTATLASVLTIGSSAGLYGTAASFTNGSTVSAQGKYKLIVTGSTGLTTEVVFCVYAGSYVKGVGVPSLFATNPDKVITYVANLAARISILPTETLTITKADGSAIANPATQKASTGMIVTVTETATSNVLFTKLVVVYGDLNIDGLVNVGDLLVMKKHTANPIYVNPPLATARLEAANCSRDVNNVIDVADALKLKKFIGNVGNITQY